MKNKIKEAMLDQFISIQAKVDHVIPHRWFVQALPSSLNPKEQEQMPNAIKELEAEGLAKWVKRTGGEGLALTQAGFDKIY